MTIRTFIDRRQLSAGIRNADLDHNFSQLAPKIRIGGLTSGVYDAATSAGVSAIVDSGVVGGYFALYRRFTLTLTEPIPAADIVTVSCFGLADNFRPLAIGQVEVNSTTEIAVWITTVDGVLPSVGVAVGRINIHHTPP